MTLLIIILIIVAVAVGAWYVAKPKGQKPLPMVQQRPPMPAKSFEAQPPMARPTPPPPAPPMPRPTPPPPIPPMPPTPPSPPPANPPAPPMGEGRTYKI